MGFLEDPKVATPVPDLLGIKLEPRATATQLTAGVDQLDGALIDVNQAEKQGEVTREAKNAAIKGYDRKFLRIARVAESVFHFAGMHELATRVRPSTRRPGRRLAKEAGEKDAREPESRETDAQPADTRVDASGESDASDSAPSGTVTWSSPPKRPPPTPTRRVTRSETGTVKPGTRPVIEIRPPVLELQPQVDARARGQPP